MDVTPHKWKAAKYLPVPVCTGCGLLRLRNPLTEWCVRNGCDHADHPQYRQTVAKLTRQEQGR